MENESEKGSDIYKMSEGFAPDTFEEVLPRTLLNYVGNRNISRNLRNICDMTQNCNFLRESEEVSYKKLSVTVRVFNFFQFFTITFDKNR